MAANIVNTELKKFHQSLLQDIRSEQITNEEGGTLEQLFTQYAAGFLAETGEAENSRIAYDEKIIRTGIQHKINAYAIADNYETLDLMITIFNGSDDITTVSKTEIDKAAKRISAFFKNTVFKNYVDEIDESAEIFQLAQTLINSKELKETLVRINAIILTDGLYTGENPDNQNISDYPVFFKVVDLNYLYNISEKSHIPIEIDFKADGYKVPCIKSPSENDQYQSYLAIIPGHALVDIYERFGARLLEQNVRSFLQFTGKVNGGIRKTILTEPHMFLAFNNGIAATAASLEIEKSRDGNGLLITHVNDLQIVNGGQTTASIYHTWKKDRKEVSDVFVQVKLSVIKNKEHFSDIVGRISEYANTQNKVSVSDLSSNRPFHIDLEKLSRDIWAPPTPDQPTQTRWFYERARGQYKNARLKEGFTKAKQKAFDLKNPKSQMFTKEDLAKYVNSFEEVMEGKKIPVGPHFVVRGNQKNYVQFINHNLPKKVDQRYLEDSIAKAILFRAAEKKYGVKPFAIGDMRYITVPYTIAWLNHSLTHKLDLYKIWKNQSVSDKLKEFLYGLMVQVEEYIKSKAPGSLYSEWAKKEDCWREVKEQDFAINVESIKEDLENLGSISSRLKNSAEANNLKINEAIERIRSVSTDTWNRIEKWGKTTGLLSVQQQAVAWNLSIRLRSQTKITDNDRNSGIVILNTVAFNAPEILKETGDKDKKPDGKPSASNPIIAQASKALDWNEDFDALPGKDVRYLRKVVEKKIELTPYVEANVSYIIKVLRKAGYQP